MPVITIGRQFGAGGEPVGRIVARRLKADLLDNEIMTEVARRLELPTDEVEAQDENPGSFLNRLLTALGSASVDFSVPPEVAAWTPPYADPAFDPRKAILNITQQVIREAARTGNVVIVGRGAGYLLRDQPGVTSVFLRAAEDVRVRFAMQAFGLDEEAARKRMKHTDANRSAYVRQVYGHDWLHPAHYDLVLDSGRLGHETCAEIILAAAKHRAG
jgi:CMP/dCMP kinase